jgi:hypothetical protein
MKAWSPPGRPFNVDPLVGSGMFRPFKKREREVAPLNETGHRRALDYPRTKAEDEPRRSFWPDREGWKDLSGTFVAELIIVIIAVWWIWFHG